MKRLSDGLALNGDESREKSGDCYFHWCPGCRRLHVINTTKPNSLGAIWTFDGNVDKPTFAPSINIVGQCHYFIRGGNIEFCSDSKHALAGQTVPLPHLSDDEINWLRGTP